MALQKQSATEADIIKAVALKRQFESVYQGIASKNEGALSDLNSKD